MAGSLRTLVMLAVALVPGGLFVLATWILGRVVAHRMAELDGAQGARLARAVASVRWQDVWHETRRSFVAPTY